MEKKEIYKQIPIDGYDKYQVSDKGTLKILKLKQHTKTELKWDIIMLH